MYKTEKCGLAGTRAGKKEEIYPSIIIDIYVEYIIYAVIQV